MRARGEPALREHAARLGDGDASLLDRADLARATDAIPAEQCALLERTGCYAPGGRFPLPSSVLMTAITARVAGVREVWVASPRPAPITRAAAAVAGVDGLLAAGGAQAIAALACGVVVPPCDVVVGPGNRWVTAAKKLVAGQVRIDMLAGPSELVVLADDSADAATIAADLLAQAEHDVDALAVLVSLSRARAQRVHACLADQLSDLPTADTARAALQRGFCVVARDVEEAVAVCARGGTTMSPRFVASHRLAEVRLASSGPWPLAARARKTCCELPRHTTGRLCG